MLKINYNKHILLSIILKKVKEMMKFFLLILLGGIFIFLLYCLVMWLKD